MGVYLFGEPKLATQGSTKATPEKEAFTQSCSRKKLFWKIS